MNETLEKLVENIKLNIEINLKGFVEKHIVSYEKPDISKEFKVSVRELYDQMGVDLEKNPNKKFIESERKLLLDNLWRGYWSCKATAWKVINEKNLGYSLGAKYYAEEILHYKVPFQTA